jgi:hypothetical protein
MLTWEQCEEKWREADKHKPPAKRFKEWKRSQNAAYAQWQGLKRMLLFFPTGEGKSKTALSLLATRGHTRVFVLAPKKTMEQWQGDARVLGIEIVFMTFEKFWRDTAKVPRGIPWIIDEYHRLGGRDGAGFKKVNRMMSKYEGDLIMASATPNYNDAERVFCLTAVGDFKPVRNYMDWLIQHCELKASRWSFYPDVLGFKKFPGALEFLCSLPWVCYVEDTAVWTEEDWHFKDFQDDIFKQYGFSKRHMRISASWMEEGHKDSNIRYLDEDGLLRDEHLDMLTYMMGRYPGRFHWLVFCAHATVAIATYKALQDTGWNPFLIDGNTDDTESVKQAFLACSDDAGGVLVCTTAIAEGIDGLETKSQSLVLFDPLVGDPSKTRQIIGRILPRGVDDGIERLVVNARFE